MNNFSGEERQFKLMSTMFQNMFPSVSVQTVSEEEPLPCLSGSRLTVCVCVCVCVFVGEACQHQKMRVVQLQPVNELY